jgi:hypothetical protein
MKAWHMKLWNEINWPALNRRAREIAGSDGFCGYVIYGLS